MPGSIRVSVLKCVDLPAEATGGKYVSMKVGVGKREFQTKPSNVDGNKTAVWNSDFAFPVLNLRDNLMVILLDSDGNAISQTEILTPVVVEKGSLEEIFPLKGGGRVHLKLSFVLTLEERMRIEAMRESALEKKGRKTVKKNAIQVTKPLEENKTNASDAAKGISQTIAENAKSKYDIQNEKNHITPIVVPQESITNAMQNGKKSIPQASPAPLSPAIRYVTPQEAPSHELKHISGHESKESGQHYLPQHDFRGALIQNQTESIDEVSLASTCLPIEHGTHKVSSYDSKKISVCDLESDTTGSPKEFTMLKGTSSLSFIMSSTKAQIEDVIQVNPPFANEHLMPAPLPTTKDTIKDHGNPGNSDFHESMDKFSMIEPGQSELEKKDTTVISADIVTISEISSQAFLTRAEEIPAPGFLLCQENSTLTMAASVSCSPPESSDSKGYSNSAALFTRGDKTSDMPPEPISLVEVDGTANVLSVETSNQEDMASSHLSTPLNVMPSQSSMDGSMSTTPLVDSPNNTKGEKNIPLPSYFPGSSQLDQMFHIHQSVDSTETQASTTAYDVANFHKGIGIQSHSDSSFSTENINADRTPSYVINAEKTEVVARAFGSVESSTNNSFDVISPSDTGSGSIASGATEGPSERSSLHTVPTQSSSRAGGLTESICSNSVNLIDSRVNAVVSTARSKPAASQVMKGSAVKAKIKAFESALSSQTMRGDGKKNGVKAKIKAFESNLTRDYHNVSPRKTNHTIEAAKARRRLQAEAAAAEAAEAKRRAEEEELKLKSITDARERKSGLPHRPYESGVRTMVNLKSQYLERNENEDKRQTKEDVKDITVSKDDEKIRETYRDKEVRIWKLHEKWPEIGGRNIKQEDMTALKRPLEQEENLLRAAETQEKTAEENPRSIAFNWERMGLAELQLKGNMQHDTLQLDLSTKQKELVEEPTVSEMLASQSSKTYEQKQDVGVQAGKTKLYNCEPEKSVAEARWLTNEEAKRKHGSDHKLIIDQRVHSLTKRDSCEEEASLSEKKLEDLVNDSTAFGGFIKQAVGAAALLATGALFMWIRGERMNRRPYFLPNDAATSRIKREDTDQQNSRISKRSKELLCP